jgi:Zn-dependent metalloprotease
MIRGLTLVLPGATFEDRARRFLDGNPALFVDRRSGDTLVHLSTETAGGANVVRFQQHHAGVPVDGAIVAVTLDTAGRIIAVSSEAEPVTLPSAQPKISAEVALRVAHRAVSRGGGGGSARLLILAEGAARLAYRVVLPFEADPAGRVHLVDASSGEYLGWRRGIISEEVRP